MAQETERPTWALDDDVDPGIDPDQLDDADDDEEPAS